MTELRIPRQGREQERTGECVVQCGVVTAAVSRTMPQRQSVEFRLETARLHKALQAPGLQLRIKMRVQSRRVHPRSPIDDLLPGTREIRRTARVWPDRLQEPIFNAGIMRGERP